jgi:hypothetical protein
VLTRGVRLIPGLAVGFAAERFREFLQAGTNVLELGLVFGTVAGLATGLIL